MNIKVEDKKGMEVVVQTLVGIKLVIFSVKREYPDYLAGTVAIIEQMAQTRL